MHILPCGAQVLTLNQHTASAALNVALESYVPEILRDRPEGVHVNEIAAVNGLEAGKLGQWDVVSPAVPRLTSP